jgi:hypothetical protein
LQSSKQAMAPIENFRRDRRLFAGRSSEQDERSNSNAIIDVIRWRAWYLARAWLVTGSAALKRSQGDSLTCESRNPVLSRVGRRALPGEWLVRVRGWHSRGIRVGVDEGSKGQMGNGKTLIMHRIHEPGRTTLYLESRNQPRRRADRPSTPTITRRYP